MTNAPTRIPRPYLLLVAAAGWFALVAQFVLMMQNKTVSSAETTLRFFSFFTILTNLLVAVCTTSLCIAPSSRWGVFFSRASTLTAVTVYITIVGVTYNVILRSLWSPQGLQRVVDELLHSVIPVLFLILWIAFVNKRSLSWAHIPYWLIYPLLYSGWVLLFGSRTGFYPYPFIDVVKLGYPAALTNAGFVLLAFLVLSALLVAIGKITKRNPKY